MASSWPRRLLWRSPIVGQAFVYGDSLQHQLVAIIVPDAEAAPQFCKENGLEVAPVTELCKCVLNLPCLLLMGHKLQGPMAFSKQLRACINGLKNEFRSIRRTLNKDEENKNNMI